MTTFLEQNKNMTLEKEKDGIFFSDKAFNNEDNYIFVLDTNALLKIFQLDVESVKIFEENLKTKKYYGTRQIEKEFLRNKDYISQYWMIDLAHKVMDDFNSNIMNQYEEFIRNYSHIFSTDETISKRIKRFSSTIANLSKAIEKTQNNYNENKGKEIINADIALLSKRIDFSTSLDSELTKKLEDEYIKQVEQYKKFQSEKIDFKNDFREYVFPGMGEKKTINPEGDYIIFHELMKLSIEKNKNIIFLTNDLKKNDWIDSKTGREYTHYKTIFYCSTGHSIKIQSFDKHLESIGIKIEKLLQSMDEYYDDEFIGSFLTKYNQLEKAARIWGVKNNIDTPILQIIIRNAHEVHLISEEEFSLYIKIRSIRNVIVHGLSYKIKDFSDDDKNNILYNIDLLISTFQK